MWSVDTHILSSFFSVALSRPAGHFGYIWTHEEACDYVVKILRNRLCAGVRYALSLIPSQSSATHSLTASFTDPVPGGVLQTSWFEVVNGALLSLVTWDWDQLDVSCYDKGCFPIARIFTLHHRKCWINFLLKHTIITLIIRICIYILETKWWFLTIS